MRELALQFGTPLYVYSQATLKQHFDVFAQALKSVNHLICYAVKANRNLALTSLLGQWGGGADVTSGGELYCALEAGIPPGKIVFSGVGKSLPEIEYALRRKILMISVESSEELARVAEVAEGLGQKAPVAVRLNPDVDAKTHPYIATGLRENKFGVEVNEALAMYEKASSHTWLDPIGLSLHIGSQITDLDPFRQATGIACDLIRQMRRKGTSITHLDLGGGLGVRYGKETPPSPADYVAAVSSLVKDLDLTLVLEPGRSLIANAGNLLTKVLYVKKREEKTFVVVDAGMNDLLRPALYHTEHEIVPVVKKGVPSVISDVVGPVCESSDVFARGLELEEVLAQDLLSIRSAGAYGFSMSSQYNGRPRVAEVLVHGDRAELIRERELFEDLVDKDRMPSWFEERG